MSQVEVEAPDAPESPWLDVKDAARYARMSEGAIRSSATILSSSLTSITPLATRKSSLSRERFSHFGATPLRIADAATSGVRGVHVAGSKVLLDTLAPVVFLWSGRALDAAMYVSRCSRRF